MSSITRNPASRWLVMMTRVHDERQQLMTGEPRESIWSVSRGVKHVYFALFIVQFSAGTIWTVLQGVASLAALWHDLSSLAVTAAALSMVIDGDGEVSDGPGSSVRGMAREKRRREQIARAVAEAVAETRLESDAEWESWLQRRLHAEQRGEPFDEPPPSAQPSHAAAATQEQ